MLEAENILLISHFPEMYVRLGGIYIPDKLWLVNQEKGIHQNQSST